MNKKILFVSAGILLLIVGVIAVFVVQKPSQSLETTISAEIEKYYTSVDELLEDSDLVVIGIFKDQERIVEPNTPRNSDSQPPYDPGRRELAFKVTDILKGYSEDLIWVAQRVSFMANGVEAMEEDTLLESSQQYMLFLNSSVQHPNEFYWLTGATQGAFLINNNGTVFSRNVIGDIPKSVGPTVDGLPLDQFISDLKK